MTTLTAVTAAYIFALMGAIERNSAAGRWLSAWIRFNRRAFEIDLPESETGPKDSGQPGHAEGESLPVADWAQVRDWLGRLQCGAMDPSFQNLASFAEAIGLDAIEAAIVGFLFQCERDGALQQLCWQLVCTRQFDSAGVVAAATGNTRIDVESRIHRGALRSLGLVAGSGDGTQSFIFSIADRVAKALLPPSASLADIERALVGPPATTSLGLADFDHVRVERDFMTRLLRGAIAGRTKGVNFLFYGPPGTGKTELCKVLAADVGADLFAIGESDDDGDEPSRFDRLHALRLADRLTARRGNALLLFDEMEDILQQGERNFDGANWRRRAGSKVFFNRLLESNATPILWTANSLWEFDAAFLRRMTFMLEMKKPSMKTRIRLWSGEAERHGLALPSIDAEMMARKHNVAPSSIKGAAQAVKLAGGNAEELDFVATALNKPFCRRSKAGLAESASFEAALTNADVDLAALECALTRSDGPRDISLCLYGPPGTGKTAFARWLAQKMGLDPLVKRASDLLSCWVGGTEQSIAEAFEEAAQDERFLIIDEADSLLWSRGSAERAWEASMVNELLTQMESHRWPFACTTNQMDRVDPAALRRFSFKVKFDFMTAEQAAAAYRHFFAQKPPAALSELTSLTPGDFAVVAKKLRFIDAAAASDQTILRLLEQEVTIKPGQKRRIGF